MITGVAFCPHPPLLVPEVAQGAARELDDLRAACRAAITRVGTPTARVAVIGGGPVPAAYGPSARGSFAGFGVDLEVPLGADEPGRAELPLSLTVGAWLVRHALGPDSGAVGYCVGEWYDDPLLPPFTDADYALLVMGDGSARRSASAPGYFDERAEPFDRQVADALRSGEGHRLHFEIDDELAQELLVAGAWTWSHTSWLLEGGRPWNTEVLYDAAPYGVGYFVATWTPRG